MTGSLKAALCAAAFTCATQAQAAIPLEISSIFQASGYTRTFDCPTGYTGCAPVETRLTGSISFRAFASDALGITAYSVDVESDQGALGLFTATVYNLGKGSPTYGVSSITRFVSTLDLSCAANCRGVQTYLASEYGSARIIDAAAVPEPSTWALMLAGFGLTGYALRRRRAKVAFA